MNEFGYFKDDKLFLKSVLEFSDREIGELRENEEKTIEYFVGRYELFEKDVTLLEDKINGTENKGSYLMKILHLQGQLGEAKILGDLESIAKRLEGLKSVIDTQIETNRLKNSTFKKAMVEEAKAIIDARMWNGGIERIKELQRNWIKTGKAEEILDAQLEEQFTELTHAFFTERKLYFEERKELSEARVLKYQALVEAAQQLTNPDKITELKTSWKSIGGIPSEAYKVKLDAFNKALNKAKKTLSNKKISSESSTDSNKNLTTQRKLLFQELEVIWEEQPDKFIYKVKEIQKRFSLLRGQFSTEDKKIADLFYGLCDRLHELSFIQFQVVEKLKISANDQEKYNQAIKKTLNKLIRRDKDELQLFEDNAENMLMFTSGEAEKLFKNQLRLKQRKLSAKQKLLSHFSEK